VGNIVNGEDMQTQVCLDCGALPMIVMLLSSPHRGIRREACWTLSNIAAGNQAQKQAVIDADAVPRLVNLCRNDEFDVRREACWTLSMATTAASCRYLVEQGIIQAMAPIIATTSRFIDQSVTAAAIKCLHNLFKMDTEGDMQCVQISREVGLDEHLVQLLQREGKCDAATKEKCQMILGRMESGSELLTVLVKPATARGLSGVPPLDGDEADGKTTAEQVEVKKADVDEAQEGLGDQPGAVAVAPERLGDKSGAESDGGKVAEAQTEEAKTGLPDQEGESPTKPADMQATKAKEEEAGGSGGSTRGRS